MSLISRAFISDFLVSIGGLPRVAPNTINGMCSSMPMALGDIWMGCPTQNIKQYLTTAETMDVTSTSANDTSGGTGARQVLIDGLDNDFNHIRELVSLNGLTTVTTSNSFLRINEANVATSGSFGGTGTGGNDGDITIESTDTSNLEGIISSVGGVPIGHLGNSHRTIPNGKAGVLRNNIDISVNRQMSADVYLMIRMNGPDLTSAPYAATRTIAVITSVEGLTNVSVNTPPSLPERTDVWLAALPKQMSTPIQVNYNIALVG